MRGDGSVYRRGRHWWITYYRDGELTRESAGTSKAEARARLKDVHRQLREGNYLSPAERTATVSDLLDDLVVHLKNRGIASLRKAEIHMGPVRQALGHVRASALDTRLVEDYKRERTRAGRAPATVNRELELTRQAFRLAAAVTPPRISRVPLIPLLKVENARQGFVGAADFAALLKAIEDPDLRDYLQFFWWTGMRPGEISKLTWAMFDPESWTLTLAAHAAKTRRARTLAIVGPLRPILERRREARRLDCPLVFHRMLKGRRGQPVKSYRKAWAAALETAKLPPGLVPYDLRRSALRNLVRSGVDVSVAMKISGHRTRATFDRYNIVDTEDVAQALERVEAYVEAQPKKRKVARVHSQNIHNQGQGRKRR